MVQMRTRKFAFEIYWPLEYSIYYMAMLFQLMDEWHKNKLLLRILKEILLEKQVSRLRWAIINSIKLRKYFSWFIIKWFVSTVKTSIFRRNDLVQLNLHETNLLFWYLSHHLKWLLWKLCAALMSWVQRWVELVV